MELMGGTTILGPSGAAGGREPTTSGSSDPTRLKQHKTLFFSPPLLLCFGYQSSISEVMFAYPCSQGMLSSQCSAQQGSRAA